MHARKLMQRCRTLIAALALCMVAPSASALCLGSTVVSGTAVQFMAYDPVSASPRTANGQITVGCAGIGVLSSYTISLSAGPGSGYAGRQLTGPAGNALQYNLFIDAGYGTIWGNGSSGTGQQGYGGLLSLSTMNFQVYGRIPAGQDRAPGSYTATITITVDF